MYEVYLGVFSNGQLITLIGNKIKCTSLTTNLINLMEVLVSLLEIKLSNNLMDNDYVAWDYQLNKFKKER